MTLRECRLYVCSFHTLAIGKGSALNRSMKKSLLRCLISMTLCATFGAFASPAKPGPCKWEWLCDGQGNCRQSPICEKLSDDPGAPPAGEPPKPPHALPPLEPTRANAQLQCEHVQRRHAKTGRWAWDQVCFCASKDAATIESPMTPLVGIKRCGT
jgi:hypothetical protein